MPTKKKPTTEAAIKPKNVVNVDAILHETDDAATARVLTKPEISAALTIQRWQGGITEVNTLASELAKQIGEVNNGNMKRPEAMLLAQAHTLDELFNNLARRAHLQEGIAMIDPYLRLALKAQTQCRATLETLAAIKNPPIIYAKQANFANGHQQVNNGVTPSHTGETKNEQNELLELKNGERLDTRATGKAIEADKAMAALD